MVNQIKSLPVSHLPNLQVFPVAFHHLIPLQVPRYNLRINHLRFHLYNLRFNLLGNLRLNHHLILVHSHLLSRVEYHQINLVDNLRFSHHLILVFNLLLNPSLLLLSNHHPFPRCSQVLILLASLQINQLPSLLGILQHSLQLILPRILQVNHQYILVANLLFNQVDFLHPNLHRSLQNNLQNNLLADPLANHLSILLCILQTTHLIYRLLNLQGSPHQTQQSNRRLNLVISLPLSPLQVLPFNLRVNHRDCHLDDHQINPQVNRLQVQFLRDQQQYLLCNPQINLLNNQQRSHQIAQVSNLHQNQAVYHRYSLQINLRLNLRFNLLHPQVNNLQYIRVTNLHHSLVLNLRFSRQ